MTRLYSRIAAALAAGLSLCGMTMPASAQTTLADQPVFSSSNVPGNLALVLSVEYPTANSIANGGNYSDANGNDSYTFLGYFDPAKCYTYNYNSTTPSLSYFVPAGAAGGTYGHQCSGQWSGNFMNWASMQTIDPFRWVLTGGYRSLTQNQGDTTTQTILEKAWADGQGGTSNFPNRGTGDTSGSNFLPVAMISKVTPFSKWGAFNSAIAGNGNQMVFSAGPGYTTAATSPGVFDLPSNVNTGASTALTDSPVTPNSASNQVAYRVYVRVAVCVSGLLESNCVKYGSNYKPEGLLQQYASTIRFSALSYLNGDGASQQGGVLRAPMNFIGPTHPQPLSTTVVTNPLSEWDPATGKQYTNPDPTSAAGSNVGSSGVINYLNQFGEYAANNGAPNQAYMIRDNVSELYYAAVRYYENLGNVPQWVAPQTTTAAKELDGFPAVATWTDPISYYCQKNFILGIGDDHTHDDYNVGGNNGASDSGLPLRTDPPLVANDTFNQSYAWTVALENLEGGITSGIWWQYPGGDGSYSTYFIAGLAYGAHVTDIRPDLGVVINGVKTISTISTYWMDVEEYGNAEINNMYYLATKYGGFTVPSGYSISNTTPLTLGQYDTSGNTFTAGQVGSKRQQQNQPDNYFLAGAADKMKAGLQSAFASISNALTSTGTAFSEPAANVSTSGSISFASQYNTTGWNDTITAYTETFDASNGNPSQTQLWASSSTLQSQLANTGWQAPFNNTGSGRNVVTWNGTAGAPFEISGTPSMSTAQLAALVPGSYSPSTTATQYLDYLRGDTTNEVGSTKTPSTKSLRARSLLLGDIVDANLAPVSTPIQSFSEANNPGYGAFVTQWTTTTPRPTMVYAAANDGMLHAFAGSSGYEQFAYVPSAVFQGPTGTPTVNGLAALGNPTFAHHYYVDATPIAFDIDLHHTGANPPTSTAATANWQTLLIGGLGKGGTSFYALNVTDPAAVTSEAAAAGDVMWEFSNSTTGVNGTLGYSFGAPIVVKTAQYGWVVAFTSGYSTAACSSSSYGYLYLVNPSNGALLKKIATPTASCGLTQAAAYVQDYTDYTADSIYVGDLNGQLWRFDLTEASGNYPAPTLLATLADGSGNAQPVTTAPLIEIHPSTRKRYVMVGTGQLLSSGDIGSTALESFYVILDGTAGQFNAVTTPITRTNLTALTASGLVAGITLSPTKLGWYIDLGNDSATGIAWRVVLNPAAYDGTLSFAALLPSGDACNPQGTGEIYSVNYATATSILTSAPAGYYAVPSAVVNLTYVGVSTGTGTNAELIAGLQNGSVIKIPDNLASPIFTRLLNWRELPSAE